MVSFLYLSPVKDSHSNNDKYLPGFWSINPVGERVVGRGSDLYQLCKDIDDTIKGMFVENVLEIKVKPYQRTSQSNCWTKGELTENKPLYHLYCTMLVDSPATFSNKSRKVTWCQDSGSQWWLIIFHLHTHTHTYMLATTLARCTKRKRKKWFSILAYMRAQKHYWNMLWLSCAVIH